jgi:PHD/YefM family antitoxin component YafN of YafNO toxin-antitoxin module
MKYSITQLHLKTADILEMASRKPVTLTKYKKDTHVVLSNKEFLKMKEKIKELKAQLRDNKK